MPTHRRQRQRYLETARQGKPRCVCAPPSTDQTYLTVGQDLFSIQDYVDEIYNYSLHEYMKQYHLSDEGDGRDDDDDDDKDDDNPNSTTTRSTTTTNETVSLNNRVATPHTPPPTKADALPAAFMVYTDIQKLNGLDAPTDYGSGIEYANGLQFPTTQKRLRGLQIGLWLGGSQGCRDIVEGRLDPQLERLFAYLSSSTTPFDPIFLRVGYEFDNPQFQYSQDPALYRLAFRHLVNGYREYEQKKRRHASPKVLFVWHSWAAGLPQGQTLQDYYPGNDYVDWIGISLFQQLYPDAPPWGGNLETVQQVLDFASSKRGELSEGGSSSSLPIMIAESTPFRGIPELNDAWHDWFQPILQLIDNPDNHIGLWSYINCDWDSQPMWHNVGFGQTRLAYNRTILKLWYENVYQNPRFLHDVDCGCQNYQDKRHSKHSDSHSNGGGGGGGGGGSSPYFWGSWSRLQVAATMMGKPPEREHNPVVLVQDSPSMASDLLWYGSFLVILIFVCFRCGSTAGQVVSPYDSRRCYFRHHQMLRSSNGSQHKPLQVIEEGNEEEEEVETREESDKNDDSHQPCETGSLLAEQRDYGSIASRP